MKSLLFAACIALACAASFGASAHPLGPRPFAPAQSTAQTPAPARTATPAPSPFYSKNNPSFSHDGKQILFVEKELTGMKFTGYRLKVMNADGTGERKIADSTNDFYEPRFSPDGKWIVFTAFAKATGSQTNVWMIGADGAGLRQLTNSTEREWDADFTSDGKAVIFLRSRKKGDDRQGGIAMRLNFADGKEQLIMASDVAAEMITPAPGGGAYLVCQCTLKAGQLVWESLYGVFQVKPDGSLGTPMMSGLLSPIRDLRPASASSRVSLLIEPQTIESLRTSAMTAESISSGPKRELHVVSATEDLKLLEDASGVLGFDIAPDGKRVVLAGKTAKNQQRSALWLYDMEQKTWSQIKSPEESGREQAQAATRQHYDRGIAFGQARRFDEAIAEFTEAIKLAPTEPLFYRNRALSYAYKGDSENALKDFAEVIRLAPNVPDAYGERGSLLAQMNKIDESLKDFTEAIRLAPKNKQLYLIRAQVYRMLNKPDLAAADEATANSLSPK